MNRASLSINDITRNETRPNSKKEKINEEALNKVLIHSIYNLFCLNFSASALKASWTFFATAAKMLPEAVNVACNFSAMLFTNYGGQDQTRAGQ